MIIELNFKNLRSFKDEQSFSMLIWSEKIKEKNKDDNFYSVLNNDIKVLKTAVIFWQNAWWKTNLLKTIEFMKRIILNSHKINPTDTINWYDPYLLDKKSKTQPSFLEVKFLINDIRYTYSFSFNKNKFLSEKLIAYYSSKPTIVIDIDRKKEKIEINSKIMKWAELIKREWIRENTLALSVLADKNNEEARKILSFFSNIYVFISGTWIHDLDTMKMLDQDPKFKFFLLQLMKDCDLWIHDIVHETKKVKFKDLEDKIKLDLLKNPNIQINDEQELNISRKWLVHYVYENWDIVDKIILPERSESKWTMQIFNFAGSIYDVMKNGKILFIDEIDKSIHPMLLQTIIKIFHKTNTKIWKYQFIFNTHDTTLLDADIFRRDQIWFVDKNKYWESNLLSLLEFKERKDSSFLKNYLNNRYWGTPFLWEWENLFDE